MLPIIERMVRVGRRFAKTGQISSSPIGIIRRALHNVPRAFFVQVGANDGISGDPLHDLIVTHSEWRGIFIEPVGYAFGKLVAGYGADSRFIFERVAISDNAGDRDFYYVSEGAVKDPSVPRSWDKLGSFNRSHITNHSLLLDKYIISERVRCEPLETVLHRHQVGSIDLIHIDVEGYDYQVLRQINFELHRPRIVLFEHSHLSAADLSKSYSLLTSHGYKIVNCGLDTLAIKTR